MSLFFKNNQITLYNDDCLPLMDKWIADNHQFNMIFSDPPYFLSNDGFSLQAGKRVSVNKGQWDKSNGLEQDEYFTFEWLKRCQKLLTPDGTIWISGTLHNIYTVGSVLQKLSFKILNDICWFKPNGPPHLACRYFAHSHETLLWAKKDKNSRHFFDYDLMKEWDESRDIIKNQGRQMRSVWSIPLAAKEEKKYGKHPTQKPQELLKRIVLSSTRENDLILDPFCGSGTTAVIAKQYNRKFIGIDKEKKFLELAKLRIENTCTPSPRPSIHPPQEINITSVRQSSRLSPNPFL